ncbi:unnamed protein product [Cuscuta campestris]|uniref:Uncharacterized protein n=1 Tax=Cuscuta campestris TaxID=132261 RepID=A0A484L0H5_9ASTE|nr:unnamed protein product [Cuscuta campestris]
MDDDFEGIDDDLEVIDIIVTEQYYSPRVYGFDLNAEHQGLKQVPSMSTGKPNACGFVANGMLYVLGGSAMCHPKLSKTSIKRFERFNPVDGKWTVLDDRPLKYFREVYGATVIETQHKVLIRGRGLERTTCMVYDFLHERWYSDWLTVGSLPYRICHIDAFDCDNGGLYLYGLRTSHAMPLPFKLGHLKELEHMYDGYSIGILSILDGPDDCMLKTLCHQHDFHTNVVMLYLGDGHFCYVISGQGCFPDDFTPPCPHTRGIRFAIFKELSSPRAVQEDREGQTCTFEAKVLYGKNYFKRLDSNGYAFLKGCFIVNRDYSGVEIRIDSHLVPKVDKFWYLGLVIQADGELDGDVARCVGAVWAKWRLASGVLGDKKISSRMKGRFYRFVVRPTMLYGAECWAVKKIHVRRLHATEMRMLWWMCGILNEVIRRRLGMTSVGDKLREARVRWFGHVRRQDADA